MGDVRFKNPIFVALDMPSVDRALGLAEKVKPHVGGLKVGLEFINACGPDGIRAIAETGLPLFVDVKLHDIPNTVAGAVRALAPLQPALLNVHASGGTAMTKTERLLSELIALPSVNPAFLPARDPRAGEHRVAEFLARRAEACGLETEFQPVFPVPCLNLSQWGREGHGVQSRWS